MKRKFLTFIRQRIGVIIVITFTTNMIMFSGILAFTASIPSEQSPEFIKHVEEKKTDDLKEEIVKRQSNDKGQMDYIPRNGLKTEKIIEHIGKGYPKQLNKTVLEMSKRTTRSRVQEAIEQINARENRKAYHMFNDNSPAEAIDYTQQRKSNNKFKDGQKPPNTFNAKYIEYFWNNPEFRKNQDSVKPLKEKPSKVKKAYNQVGKDGHKKPTNKFIQEKAEVPSVSGIEARQYRELQRKSDVMKSARANQEQLAPNVSYITMFQAKGKLGNQMFQLASLLGIADTGNFTPFLPTSEFELHTVFRLPQGFSKDVDISEFDNFSDECCSQGNSIKLSKALDTQSNWTLEGYFQSFKYFSNVTNKVKKYLQFHKNLLVRAAQFLQRNVPDGHVKVAIHIRRGDFISSYQRKLGRVAATAGYVRRAMQYFQSRYKNITFIVVSDDMRWCTENIKGDNVKFSTSPYSQKGLDLAIISNCDHVIISVGTFGWWGGWLSRGTVIYYKNFLTPGSDLDKTFIPENYYPSQWISLE